MTISFTTEGSAVLFTGRPHSIETSAEAAVERAAKLNEALLRIAASDMMEEDASKSDPDDDGDDDTNAKGDTDHDYWTPGGKQKKPLPGKPLKK